MNGDASPIALEYAAPTPFFVGEYRARTPGSLGGAVALATLGGGLVAIASVGRFDAAWPVRMVLLGLGGLWLALAAWIALAWAIGRVTPVRVTSDGIEIGRCAWPWHRVARVGGVSMNGGVLVRFQPRGTMRMDQLLWTTPALSEDAYHALRVELDHYFQAQEIVCVVDREIHRNAS